MMNPLLVYGRGRTQWEKERPELTMVHAWVWMDNPAGPGGHGGHQDR